MPEKYSGVQEIVTSCLILVRDIPRKRDLSIKDKQQFTVIIERDADGYFVAILLALRACYTQAKNLDTLVERVHEVIGLCLETGEQPDSLELLGIQQITV